MILMRVGQQRHSSWCNVETSSARQALEGAELAPDNELQT